MEMNDAPKKNLILAGAALADLETGEVSGGWSVAIEDGKIREVAQREIGFASAERIDLGGLTLLPGLIDCHVHVAEVGRSTLENIQQPTSYIAIRAAASLRAMLHRGFTTVRDAGGADAGLVRAVEEGYIEGPRLVICGKQLSPTSGHAAVRGQYGELGEPPYVRRLGAIRRACDGIPAIRRACREELTAGARFLKVMANGSVTSPTDPIEGLLFSREEIRAFVEEAANAKTYVAAHVYTDEAIRRVVDLGVRSIEHGNLVSAETARAMAAAGAMACPTLIAVQALRDAAETFGLTASGIAKAKLVHDAGLNSLSVFKEAGVTMAYGTDLLGPVQHRQLDEFVLRAQVLAPREILRAATVDAAKLLRMDGKVGVIAAGAHADLVAVRGNPLKDIGVMSKSENMALIMKGGQVIRHMPSAA